MPIITILRGARELAKLIVATGLMVSLAVSAALADINIYSYRQPDLLAPLLAKFTEQTGIQTRVLFANKGLEDRISVEGANSPADLLLTTDIGKLDQAKALGIAAPVTSDVIGEAVPEAFRDPDGMWFGLSLRARVVYASLDRTSAQNLSYADLADPKWAGRICTRSGQHPYNIGLIASIIAKDGVDEARAWLEGVRDNLARKPTGNDRAQVKAIYSGECDISIGNTYYMGLMQTNTKDPEQQDWAGAVQLIFPTHGNGKTHVNLSGMVLAKHAPNRAEAIKLMEFLVSDEAQAIYAEVNHEYPVKPGIAASERVVSWGSLVADDLPLAEIARLRKEASRLVDTVAFDAGPQ